jgi:hypothetical protein
MSKFEQDAAPVLKPLLSATHILGVSLNADQAGILARWAFKTAIVRNLGTNYRQLVPRDHFSALHETQLPPDCVFVDLALEPSHRTLAAVQSQTALGIARPGDADALEAQMSQVYNIVLLRRQTTVGGALDRGGQR